MKKKNLHNILDKLIETIVREETDKALELSNKRRKKFKKQFKLHEAAPGDPNDPMTSATNGSMSAGVPGGPPADPSAVPGANPTDPTAMSSSGSPGGGDMNNGSPPMDAGAPPSNNTPDEDDTEPKDPVQALISQAEDLAKQPGTSNPASILSAAKTTLQQNKDLDPNQIIKALVDTKKPLFMNAAKRLQQFLRAAE